MAVFSTPVVFELNAESPITVFVVFNPLEPPKEMIGCQAVPE